ncbi:MAG: Hpt domain-containing protein [Betaproteobacteria bacterium]|nr:Hpt domain-containing protein [Betaproteobacteria bacterium]
MRTQTTATTATPSEAIEVPIIDLATLDQLNKLPARGGEPLGVRASRLFLKSAPTLIEQIKRGLSEHTAADIRMGAHTLKSSSASIGAHELSITAKELEEKIRSGQFDDVPTLVSKVESGFQKVQKELERIISQTIVVAA